ncbi:MAG: isochorismatase family cysteine hydrolase, partial [Pseudomonadota bacterium]
FVHADGWFAAKGIDVAPLSAPVPTIRALADAAREADLPVVWLNWGVAPGAPNLPANALFRGKRTADAIGYAEGAPGALVAGTWGAATIDALAPQAGDIYVSKQRFSGFPDAPLDSVLRNLGVTTLLFVGVNIDRCVFATLMDASARGYVCLLVEDACATVSPPEIAATIVWLTAELHGFVCQAAAVQSALASPPPTERG